MRKRTRAPGRRQDDRARATWRADADEDQPRDRRLVSVRWSRVYFGLFLIVVAIIWLVINNALGLNATPDSPVSAPSRPSIPALGVTQRAGTLTATAKLDGYYPNVAGRQALAGQRFLVIAARLINGSAAPIVARPSQFSLRASGGAQPGAALPRQSFTLFTRPVAPGATAEGYLFFARPLAQGASAILTYTPAGQGATRSLSWRIG
jgi:hypothetical protein